MVHRCRNAPAGSEPVVRAGSTGLSMPFAAACPDTLCPNPSGSAVTFALDATRPVGHVSRTLTPIPGHQRGRPQVDRGRRDNFISETSKAAAFPVASRGIRNATASFLAERPNKDEPGPRQKDAEGRVRVLSRQGAGRDFVHSDEPHRVDVAGEDHQRQPTSLVTHNSEVSRFAVVPDEGPGTARRDDFSRRAATDSHWSGLLSVVGV